MDENENKPDTNARRAAWLEYVAWICAAAAMSPVFYWLGAAVVDSQQLRDSFIILVVAGIVIAMSHEIRPHRPHFSADSLTALCAAYAAFFGAQILGDRLGIIPTLLLTFFGVSAFIVSAGLACFDRKRYVYAFGGAFFIFTLLSIAVRIFDLPLRMLAGKLSALVLSLFNDTVGLYMMKGSDPQIAMNVGGASYLVATECNGFGIISSCIVLSAILTFFGGSRSIFKKGAIVIGSGLIGYILNSLRIVSIIAVAPLAGEKGYFYWHEAFGYFYFAVAMLVVIRLSRRNP